MILNAVRHPAVTLYRLSSLIHWTPRERSILTQLDSLRGSGVERVFDFGCGPGLLARSVRSRGLAYFGVDSNVAAIEYCIARWASSGAEFEVVQPSDAMKPPTVRDVVVMNGVIHHLDDEALARWAEWSRSAAAVVIADHWRGKDTSRLVRVMQNGDRGKHVRNWSDIVRIFGPPRMLDTYPITFGRVTLWDYFTATFRS